VTLSPGDLIAAAAMLIALGGFSWKILEHLLGRGDTASAASLKRIEEMRIDVSAKLAAIHVRIDAIRNEYVRRDDLHPQLDRLADQIEQLGRRLDELLTMMVRDRTEGR
jgi:hypothetical protein